jgi:hypothetical protein
MRGLIIAAIFFAAMLIVGLIMRDPIPEDLDPPQYPPNTKSAPPTNESDVPEEPKKESAPTKEPEKEKQS